MHVPANSGITCDTPTKQWRPRYDPPCTSPPGPVPAVVWGLRDDPERSSDGHPATGRRERRRPSLRLRCHRRLPRLSRSHPPAGLERPRSLRPKACRRTDRSAVCGSAGLFRLHQRHHRHDQDHPRIGGRPGGQIDHHATAPGGHRPSCARQRTGQAAAAGQQRHRGLYRGGHCLWQRLGGHAGNRPGVGAQPAGLSRRNPGCRL